MRRTASQKLSEFSHDLYIYMHKAQYTNTFISYVVM